MRDREQYYFDTLKPEYNILKVAGSSLGRKVSEETKALLSLSATGRIFSPEMREKKMANSSVYKQAILISKIGMEEILLFPSMVKGAEYLGISRSQVSKYIKNNKPYKEFTITKLSETINSSEKLNSKPFNLYW